MRRDSDARLLTMDHRRLYAFQKALPASAEVEVKLLHSSWAIPRVQGDPTKAWKAVQVEDQDVLSRFPRREVRL